MTLTSGPHRSAAGAKKKRRKGGSRAGGGGEELGRCGSACTHAREKEAGGPGQFVGCGKRRKRKAGRGGGVGRKGGKGKGERFGFFFLNFFKIIFQTFKLHSNKKPCIRIFIISNFI
jgi:hypothetical protein